MGRGQRKEEQEGREETPQKSPIPGPRSPEGSLGTEEADPLRAPGKWKKGDFSAI